jgi:hypothetical protein
MAMSRAFTLRRMNIVDSNDPARRTIFSTKLTPTSQRCLPTLPVLMSTLGLQRGGAWVAPGSGC